MKNIRLTRKRTIPYRYAPKGLTKSDRKKQLRSIKLGIDRPKIKSYKSRRSNWIVQFEKKYETKISDYSFINKNLLSKKNKSKIVSLTAYSKNIASILDNYCDIVLVGDSLGLAIDGSNVKTDKILMCGVHFMAETAKIMSPEKKVILPDFSAGCSLADSITAQDVREMKKKYPGVPVVTYVNTTADVKAETDICCTSANAVKIVESLNVDKVIFLPDEYLAKYVAAKTDVKIISWKGKCEVHEQFTEKEITELREKYPNLKVVSHPECPPDVIRASDFTGSTGSMITAKSALSVATCRNNFGTPSSARDSASPSACAMCG